MARKLIVAWAVAATLLLLITTAVLFTVLMKPDVWLDTHVKPKTEVRQIRSLRSDVDDLESCLGDDVSFGAASALGSGCGDSLTSRVDDLDNRVDDACDQIYQKFSDSQGC